MIEGSTIAEAIRARAAGGASRDELIRSAVRAIRDADPKYDWVGVYLLEGDTLVLHHYVGRPTEHTRIPVGVGICGTAVAERRDLNVPDVHAVENYLACSVETQSECVVLLRRGARILGQIDIDSDRKAAFDERDLRELRLVADALAEALERAPAAEG
jgi:L-methionine (R)-S-oxide reductase